MGILSSRRVIIAGVLSLLLALPLIALHLTSQPVSLEASHGGATIRAEADRNRVLFPAECVFVNWQLEGIQAVQVDDVGRVGVDNDEVCLVNYQPRFLVTFQDGTQQEYRLPIEQLYRSPLVLALWFSLAIALGSLAYMLGGGYGLLTVLVIAIFGGMMRTQVNLGIDYILHTHFAEQGLADFRALPPHFLYHVSLITTSSITNLPLEYAAFIVVMIAYVATALAIYALLRALVADRTKHESLKNHFLNGLLVAVTLAIMLLGPVRFLTDFFDDDFFSALINPNSIHNPTVAALRPLALALFLGVLAILKGHKQWWLGIVLFMLTLAGTLAKPSFTMALLPALGLVLVYDWFTTRRLSWKLIILGIFIPAGLVLGWQYLYLYGPAAQSTVYDYQGNARIAFAPLDLHLNHWHVPPALIIPQLLVSVAFPLAVYGLHWRTARRDWSLNLAWLTFIIGASLAYLFVEIPGQESGNLTWSGQITLLVLFVVSAGFLLREHNPKLFGGERLQLDWRLLVCGLLLGAHLLNRIFLFIEGMYW